MIIHVFPLNIDFEENADRLSIMSDSGLTIPKALDTAKEAASVPQNISRYLEQNKIQIWTKIQQNSNYVMTKEEFMVMSYYNSQYSANDRFQGAVRRFWLNFKGNPAEVDGVGPS